jgi:hypothetical protein
MINAAKGVVATWDSALVSVQAVDPVGNGSEMRRVSAGLSCRAPTVGTTGSPKAVFSHRRCRHIAVPSVPGHLQRRASVREDAHQESASEGRTPPSAGVSSRRLGRASIGEGKESTKVPPVTGRPSGAGPRSLSTVRPLLGTACLPAPDPLDGIRSRSQCSGGTSRTRDRGDRRQSRPIRRAPPPDHRLAGLIRRGSTTVPKYLSS